MAAAVALVAIASPTGVAAAAQFSSATPLPLGTIWVLNTTSIVGYPAGSTGNVAPSAVIAGVRVGLVDGSGLAITTSGALWVSDAGSNVLKEFAPGEIGNVTPSARISGSKTLLHSPSGIAVTQSGALWVLNDDPSDGSASLVEFAAGAHGNVAPIARIAGHETRLFPSDAIAVSKSGKHVWVAHVEAGSGLNTPALQEFKAATPGDVAAVSTIAGRHTRLDYPAGLAIGGAGDLVVSDDPDAGTVSAILTFSVGASGDAKPLNVVSGARTDVDRPATAALDAFGGLWAPNREADSLARFTRSSSGDVAPKQLIVGKKTDLRGPVAVAVYATQPGTPAGLTISRRPHRRLTVTWRAPTDNGGGLLGYRLFTKVSAHGRWALVTRTNQRSFTTGPLAKHHRDYFAVSAFNALGSSPRTVPVSDVIA